MKHRLEKPETPADFPAEVSKAGGGESPSPDARHGTRYKVRKWRIGNSIWKYLISRRVAPLIGGSGSEFEVARLPMGAEKGHYRRSRYVRFVHFNDGDPIVVKGAWALPPFLGRLSRLKRFRQSAQNSMVLERFGINAPHLYGTIEGSAFLGWLRYYLLVEEFVQGRSLDRLSSKETNEAISMLARMHDQARSFWGLATETNLPPRPDYLREVLKPRVMRVARVVRRWYRRQWPSRFSDRLWEIIAKSAPASLSEGGLPFRLIHGDVTPHNVVFTPRGVRMLDLVTVRYDLPGPEIIESILALTKKGTPLRRQVWRTYFDRAGPDRWREFLDQSAVSLLYFGFRELSKRRALGLSKGAPDPKPETIAEWLLELERRSPEIWGSQPAETDFDLLGDLLFEPLPPELRGARRHWILKKQDKKREPSEGGG
ncbi:aminoglycoside phosphotransferase family protein [Candidatus Sumerlaeota bacterium]|nr:aminoglycoside phosphotransferase family protein [Candidatus Sumerlaeota bacterium]